jgi:hypothetical protein
MFDPQGKEVTEVLTDQGKEVTEVLTELHSEVCHSLYVSFSPIIMKSVVMRWGIYGARSGGKNIPTPMRDIYKKYDTFKSQAYKEHYAKIQLGEMGYENTD